MVLRSNRLYTFSCTCQCVVTSYDAIASPTQYDGAFSRFDVGAAVLLLRAELSSADFAHVKTNEHYMLSATLMRLDSTLSPDSVRATCVVSVALLRDGGATLYAVIHGRATADDARAHVDAAQSDALRAAVHSAMTRVPQALH